MAESVHVLPLPTDKRQFFTVKSTKQRTKCSEQHLRKETFLLQCFTKRTDAFARKFESYECQTATETAPCFPTRSTSSLARLLTRCVCFVMVRCSCCHMPAGLHNIVTEHVVGTLTFPFHFVFRIGSCIFSFRAHISSWAGTRDATLIHGLNHGWNRTIVRDDNDDDSRSNTISNDSEKQKQSLKTRMSCTMRWQWRKQQSTQKWNANVTMKWRVQQRPTTLTWKCTHFAVPRKSWCCTLVRNNPEKHSVAHQTLGFVNCGKDSITLNLHLHFKNEGSKGGNNVVNRMRKQTFFDGCVQPDKEHIWETNFLFDNCAGQNDNQMALRISCCLANKGCCDVDSATFLVIQNANNNCNRMFNLLKKQQRKRNSCAPQDVPTNLFHNSQIKAIWADHWNFFDLKRHQDEHLGQTEDVCKNHVFKCNKTDPENIHIQDQSSRWQRKNAWTQNGRKRIAQSHCCLLEWKALMERTLWQVMTSNPCWKTQGLQAPHCRSRKRARWQTKSQHQSIKESKTRLHFNSTSEGSWNNGNLVPSVSKQNENNPVLPSPLALFAWLCDWWLAS